MKIWYGVKTKITHFRFFPISTLIFATVQKFALDDLRDQQILIPTCEWGWAVVVPLLGETLEVEDSPGMVWCCSQFSYCHHGHGRLQCWWCPLLLADPLCPRELWWKYRSLQVTPGTVLTARVGDQREASSLAISGGDTITAQPGQDGHYSNATSTYDGGAGYSGGGG